MRFPFFLALSLLVNSSFAETSSDIQIKESQWKQRILLIHSPDAKAPQALAFGKQQTKFSREIKERDLITITADAITRKRLKISEKSFSLLLIGKDGGVKARQNQQIDLKKLFTLIDSMPMRKQEMKERK